MKVLLDTCVLAELRHPNGNSKVKTVVSNLPDKAIFLSVLTIGEITKGIFLLPKGRKKDNLTAWLISLEEHYSDRILQVDRDAAIIWGEISALKKKEGIQIPAIDGLLAATALRHGLHMMTRNVRDFAATGVLIADPWQDVVKN